MELNRLFIKYKTPEQIIYSGDKKVELFRIKKGVPEKISSYEREKSERFFPVELKNDLINTNTGIILNSGHFVFNLLTFDKIPFRKKQKDDLVNWRVQKLFPENIDSYIHQFIQFDRKTILSVLVRNDLFSEIESEAGDLGAELNYSGNSTLEIMNYLRSRGDHPDFFIESDGSIMLSVFFRDGIPVYIRKMRTVRGIPSGTEIYKTVEYVEKNYGFKPHSCSVFSVDGNGEIIKNELREMKFTLIDHTRSDMRFLPGVK
ncbi:MAG: hypothetical protein KAS97_04800 [Candidatus Aminicenantes bacterium]|nr:hypothetical protein [Candidatus Aminicenantes bacterium]